MLDRTRKALWVCFIFALRNFLVPSLAFLSFTLAKPLAFIFSTVALLLSYIPGMSLLPKFLAWFITEHRSWFIVFIIPGSLLFDLFFFIRAWITRCFFSDPELHMDRVREVQRQVREAVAANSKTKLCTSRAGWEAMSTSLRPYKANLSCSKISINLYDIMGLDEQTKTVLVEPMVNMGQLSHFLVPKGYTIPVLPEMDDLTVGGLFLGVGIETSSQKYGLFNDSVVEASIVTANGDLVTCSRTENSELFDALPWSYGTLGFLVSVKIKVIPCSPYVRVDYMPFHNKAEALAAFEELSIKQGQQSPDFVEALQYSKNDTVVMPGYWASEEDMKKAVEAKWAEKNTISWWYKPWFYKHAQQFLKSSTNDTDASCSATAAEGKTNSTHCRHSKAVHSDFIPLRDYYHRHTKSIFWELELIVPISGAAWFRFLFGWAMPPKVSFLKLTQTEEIVKLYQSKHVAQDMLVPISEAAESLDLFHEAYNIYPLWLCPFRAYDYSSVTKGSQKHRCFLRKPAKATQVDLQTKEKFELYIDLGAYGTPQDVFDKKEWNYLEKAHQVESFVASKRGFQMLYADVYMAKADFEAMFDHGHYLEMKKKYDPNGNFPMVYDKVATIPKP